MTLLNVQQEESTNTVKLTSWKYLTFPPQNHIESLQTDPARQLACSFQCMRVIEKIGGTEMHAGGMKEGEVLQ